MAESKKTDRSKSTKKQNNSHSNDQISVGNIAKQAAVAVGRGARAQIRVFNVNIQLLPVVGLLLIIIGILTYFLLRPTIPEEMTGEFNVAVAEFTVVTDDGSPVSSEDGQALANFLFQRLDSSFAELDPQQTIRYEIWPPAYTGQIRGETREQRAEAAEALADRIKAHVIIYGVITESGDRSQFAPEFYVNYKGFEEGEEITGQHELGSTLRVRLPFEATQLQAVENPALSGRANALGLITIGLAYYSIDNFEQALAYFSQAEANKGWLENAGKEIIYLLLGNANVRLASKEKSDQYLSAALDYYNTALDINGAYTRAKVGQASALYLMALGDPTNPSFETVASDQLDQAATAFENALTLGNPPASANIRAKVNFGLGQIDLVRSQMADGDWLAQAEAKFKQVVQEYEQGNGRIIDLAGHAYARLALIASLHGNVDTAADHYTRATQLVTPYYQGYYYTRLGEVYARSEQIDQAIEAYDEAIKIAEFYGDAASVATYSKRLDELRRGK
jgi:tetratricopeptide (TPR) repeat protein